MSFIKKISVILIVTMLILTQTITIMVQGTGVDNKIKIEYYYYSTCDGCKEAEAISLDLTNKIKDVVNPDEYEITMKDLTVESVLNEFNEKTASYKTAEFTPHPPLLILDGDIFLFGIDEITNQLRDIVIDKKNSKIKDSGIYSSMQNIDPTSSYFVYLYAPSCADCEVAGKFIDKMDKVYILSDESKTDVKVNYINIGEFDNIEVANFLYNSYSVPQEKRKAPIVFYSNGYLQGFKDIAGNIGNEISNGKALNWKSVETPTSYGKNTTADFLTVALMGLFNGISPCGISILLLFVSLLIAQNKKILKLGLIFIAAKSLVFLLFGTLFFTLFVQIIPTFSAVFAVIKVIVIILAFVFAFLNLLDAYMAKKERYGEIRMQLPKALRAFNERFMTKMTTKSKRLIGLFVFIGAIVVSTGEFICTGQLFLITIIERGGGIGFIQLLTYVICMSIPLVILLLIAQKGVWKLTEIARKNLPYIKIIYACLFLIFAALLILL